MVDIVEALVSGGKATAGPPLGPSLGPLGINIKQVVDDINEATKEFDGMQVPVKVIVDADKNVTLEVVVDADKNVTLEVGIPPTSALILKEIGIEKGSSENEIVGDLTVEQVMRVARMKKDKVLSYTPANAAKEIIGACVPMGGGDDKTIPDIARAILDEGLICDHCLGRQFAKLSTGLTNRERGAAIRLVLVMTADMAGTGDEDEPRNPDLQIPERCWVCNGIFEELDLWASRAIDAICGREYETFLVGTRLSGLLSENEELLWEAVGTDHAEPLKSEINREVGKLIASATGKEVNFTEPDIVCLLEISKGTVELQIRSEYICD